jgi:hypothetical protein
LHHEMMTDGRREVVTEYILRPRACVCTYRRLRLSSH